MCLCFCMAGGVMELHHCHQRERVPKWTQWKTSSTHQPTWTHPTTTAPRSTTTHHSTIPPYRITACHTTTATPLSTTVQERVHRTRCHPLPVSIPWPRSLQPPGRVSTPVDPSTMTAQTWTLSRLSIDTWGPVLWTQAVPVWKTSMTPVILLFLLYTVSPLPVQLPTGMRHYTL